MMRNIRRIVKPTLNTIGLMDGNNKFETAPIPAISAPIIKIIAGTLRTIMKYIIGLE